MPGPSVTPRGDRPDLLTALIFVALGALGLFLARALDGGTPAQMGPGFVPRVVCVLLILVGLAVGLPALRRPLILIEPVKARPVVVILLSIVGFGLTVNFFGFVVASLWLILSSALADPGGKLRQTLLLAGGLTVFGALIFVYGLGVQVPLWPY